MSDYSASPNLVSWLRTAGINIAFSSYQSNKLYVLGCNPKGGLQVDERVFTQPMGLAVQGNRMLVACAGEIVELTNPLQPNQRAYEDFDACFTTRRVHVTGALDAHDVGLDTSGDPVFVATKYNCLARLSDVHSFEPLWRPPFVSRLIAEDRCHLNGLAMAEGTPAYVTAASRSDVIDGWRDRRRDGGIVMDVAREDVLAEGFSMPHSPRLHRGALYVLNSGSGDLVQVDRTSGTQQTIAFLPGFVRGLSFHGHCAIVGLSRPRYKRFTGLPLDEKLKAADSGPWTGIQIVDLNSGAVVAWFRMDGPVAEIYDVAAIEGVSCTMTLGPSAPELGAFVTHPSQQT